VRSKNVISTSLEAYVGGLCRGKKRSQGKKEKRGPTKGVQPLQSKDKKTKNTHPLTARNIEKQSGDRPSSAQPGWGVL